jgi:hypothetical protein
MAAAPLLVIAMLVSPAPAAAQQAAPQQQPLDVMLVIDNSCSMFPAEQRIEGCEVWGNDPGFLRITGASLFIARMGFAAPAAADYQIGVISMGENPPELVSPLQPLSQGRDALARAISSPTPKLATQLVPALEMAYRELRESPQRRPGNQPAVVLLTDGAPYPAAGQTNEDIERLVSANPDVPLFVILLQNPERTAAGYDKYIRFWEDMQLRHNFVRAYPVNDTAEIERTYDEIVARLEDSVARPPISLAPDQTLEVFVSRYVQRMVLTFSRERGQPPGDIEIVDPAGVAVQDGDADVERFRGADNPVEVISVGRGRLDQAPRDANWKITSDVPVWLHLDMEGAYRIEFIEPEAGVTSVPGQYLAERNHPPGQPLTIKLRLVDNATGAVITDPQPITGSVTNPDGSTAALPIPPDLRPDADGVYTITYDLASSFPAAADTPGRYAFAFEAGRIMDPSGGAFPIARAELLVDVRHAAFIDSLSTESITCAAGQPAELSLTLGDLAAAQPGSVRVSVFGGEREIPLSQGDAGMFSGSLGPVCEALVATLACGTESDETLRVRVVSQNADGSAAPAVERQLPVHVVAASCTPTPIPTATLTPRPTATPTPAPTPIPDTDGDGYNDLTDRCLEARAWPIARLWGGCPPPLAMQILGGVGGLGLAAFLAFYAVPMGLVMTVQQPPGGYVQVYRNGKAEGAYRSLKSLGQANRSSTVTIGSQGMLKVAGLEAVELRVERRGATGVVLRGAKGPQLFQIREIPSSFTAANGTVVLKFAADPRQLR